MPHLILVRHGQSEWNLEKRFTGWVDVKLSSIGKLEACKAGESIKEQNINIHYFYSSFQLRAINTLKLIKDTLRNKNEIIKAWELNERHYGALTGLNKDEIKKKIGEKKILELRRSWNIRPEPLDRNSPYHPLNIETYKSIPKKNVPDTESLEDTFNRVVSYYKHEIENKLAKQKNILISAHGNSIRALCKYLFKLDNKQIINLEIPTGNPLVIQLDQKYEIKNCKYLIKEKARDLIIF